MYQTKIRHIFVIDFFSHLWHSWRAISKYRWKANVSMCTRLSWKFVLYTSKTYLSMIRPKTIKGNCLTNINVIYVKFLKFLFMLSFSSSVIKINTFSYVVYKAYLKYLHTNIVDLIFENISGKSSLSWVIIGLNIHRAYSAD